MTHLNAELAQDVFHQSLMEILARYESPNIMELGGGGRPHFSEQNLPRGVKYYVNDIDSKELSTLPSCFAREVFDAAGKVPCHLVGKFDVVFSRMFAEHIRNSHRMDENIFQLLKPGGTVLHLAPKLYSAPLLANWLLPEGISKSVLYLIDERRGDTGSSKHKKFPAFYSGLRGRAATIEHRFVRAGFGEVKSCAFYGHDYYRKFPMLDRIQHGVRKLCRDKKISLFATLIIVEALKKVGPDVGMKNFLSTQGLPCDERQELMRL
ncbi:methyltransferase domain-containing protein [Paracoccus endophyticus]|uniref:methyltransferase domain-containing protein n=1 Tax=Paracoccus endophyticus TaxID=2233774 RepID=UPI0013A6CFB7|nr:methyltransferase domain-containing protein [Paracoccus endophyticus]